MEVKQLPVVVNPSVVVSPHPLSASAGRKLFYNKFIPGESLGQYLERLALMPARAEHFIFSINGRAVSLNACETIYPVAGDMVVIRACVHDGGGGGGSDPVRVALTIAVLAASSGTALGGIAAVHGAGVYGPALVAVGGMLLVNALIPINVPSFDDPQPSPTYSLAGSANRARLFEPLPLPFGVVRMYPDHGAKPFTSYEGTDQMLTQVFNFGLSDVALSDFKIGDTDLDSFDIADNALEESVGNSGVIDSYPANVDSIAGGDLVAVAGSYITRTTSVDTTLITLDFSGVNFYYDTEDGYSDSRLKIIAEYSVKDANNWQPFFYLPFLPDRNEWQFINNNQETRRFSFSQQVTAGQYDVRVKLLDEAAVLYHNIECEWDQDGVWIPGSCVEVTRAVEKGIEGPGMTHVLIFDQMKSYQSDTTSYLNQKRAALKIRASGQLAGRIDAFNALVSVSVPVWTGAAFVNQVSSNPAWQFLSLARGKFDGSRRLYGAGLPDARLDIDTIKLWGVWCDAKSLECNIVFDGKTSVIDMLNTIARCGRAAATWSNGALGVVYDEANKPAVAVFGMSNIIRDSFSINYITQNQVDEVTVAFNNADPTMGYQRDTVKALVPGVVNPVNTVTIDIKGITSEAQAGKEANLLAAEQFYRRRMINWESDMEGLTVQRGDVAILSHDITQWGYSGRLVSGTTNTLFLDRKVTFTPSTQHYIGVRYPDGSYVVAEVNLLVDDQDVISLAAPLPSSPDADADNEPVDYMWVFDPKATPGKQVKITDIQPLSETRVRITATDEDDNFYLAESDTYIYVPPGGFLANVPTIADLKLGETLVVIGAGYGSKVNVSWAIEGEYGGAFVQAKDETNTYFTDLGKTLDKRFSFEWPTGRTVVVRVVAYNLNFEHSDISSAEASILLIGKAAPPSDVANFIALQNGTAVVLKWTNPVDLDLKGTEVRYGARNASTWEDATPLTVATKGTNITSQDVPNGDWTFYAKHLDNSTPSNYSVNAATYNLLFDSEYNIISQIEQSPDWPGTLTNFVLHHTGVLVPKSQNLASTDGWDTFDIFVPNPYLICSYEAPEIDIGFDDNVRIWGDIQSFLGPGETGVADPALYVDYKLNLNSYDGFELWSVGKATCRQVKFKLEVDTSVGITVVSGFNPTVDITESVLSSSDSVVVPAGGATIVFSKPFHVIPFVRVFVNATSALFPVRTNITTTSFDVKVFDSSGIDVGGIIDWEAIGAGGVVVAPSEGALQFSESSYTVAEGGLSANITVTRVSGSTGAVSVDYATSNGSAFAGSDYTQTNGTLNFADGVISQSFSVPILNDTDFEGNETLNLSLSNPTGGAVLGSPSSASLTIVDDDAIPTAGSLQFSSSVYSVNENTASITITVNRVGGSSGIVGINYTTSNGTAIAAQDYTAASGTLTFADGVLSQTFNVTIFNDGDFEGNETVNLTLSNPTGGAVLVAPSTAILTIVDDEAPPTGDNVDWITGDILQWQGTEAVEWT